MLISRPYTVFTSLYCISIYPWRAYTRSDVLNCFGELKVGYQNLIQISETMMKESSLTKFHLTVSRNSGLGLEVKSSEFGWVMRKCVLVLWCVFLSKLSIVVFPLFAAISVLWFLSVGISIVCLFDLLFCSVWVKTCRVRNVDWGVDVYY